MIISFPGWLSAKVKWGVLLFTCLMTASAAAQDISNLPNAQGEGLRDVGRTADSAVGVVGRRQSKADAAPTLQPQGRLNNRVQNRVQNRIRNRIDRDYDPRGSLSSPFEVASDDARNAATRK